MIVHHLGKLFLKSIITFLSYYLLDCLAILQSFSETMGLEGGGADQLDWVGQSVREIPLTTQT